ncbi:hypothetical protein KCU65_g205, partial [Aureobasidium melanogenum]
MEPVLPFKVVCEDEMSGGLMASQRSLNAYTALFGLLGLAAPGSPFARPEFSKTHERLLLNSYLLLWNGEYKYLTTDTRGDKNETSFGSGTEVADRLQQSQRPRPNLCLQTKHSSVLAMCRSRSSNLSNQLAKTCLYVRVC